MNTDLMFSSKTDLWATPQAFFDKVNSLYNFATDLCAIASNAKCTHFFSPEDDGLSQVWEGVCWLNPPYGREIGEWIKKAYTAAIIEKKATVVALLPARTDTKYFHEFIYKKDGVNVEFIKGRLKFGEASASAPFPSMLVTFGEWKGGVV